MQKKTKKMTVKTAKMLKESEAEVHDNDTCRKMAGNCDITKTIWYEMEAQPMLTWHFFLPGWYAKYN